VSLRDRLERLEARAKHEQPPPRSEKRESAFKGLCRTLGELRGLMQDLGVPCSDRSPGVATPI
jgi:hypothetical protein